MRYRVGQRVETALGPGDVFEAFESFSDMETLYWVRFDNGQTATYPECWLSAADPEGGRAEVHAGPTWGVR